MPRRARVVTSNRQGNPPELRELSAGRYVVAPVQEEALVLTSDGAEHRSSIERVTPTIRLERCPDAGLFFVQGSSLRSARAYPHTGARGLRALTVPARRSRSGHYVMAGDECRHGRSGHAIYDVIPAMRSARAITASDSHIPAVRSSSRVES